MTKYIKYFALVAMAVATVACTAKFNSFNEDPHNASQEDMAHDGNYLGIFFKGLERSVIPFAWGTEDDQLDGVYQNAINLTSDIWAGYMMQTNFTGAVTDSYVMTDGYIRWMFNQKLKYTMGNWNKIDAFVKENKLEVEQAIANIVKIAAMHQVTDYYGPIPYSEAGDLTPAYDSQEVIYTSFFDELDKAIEVLENTSVTSALTDNDIVYHGNVAQWLKFANSLRLRLAMRVVYVKPDLAKAEAEKSASSKGGLITSKDDNAYVHPEYDNAYAHHPLKKINEFNNGDTMMGGTIDCYLNGYSDPRLPKMFKAAAKDGKYHGVRQGIQPGSWDKYNNAGNSISAPNADNYKLMWMNAAEVAFLQAEGALRGWQMGGTAKEFYEKGIALSFDEWGVEGAASYAANTTLKPANFVDAVDGKSNVNIGSTCTIAYNSTNFETSLEKIITQKWIALFPNGPEGWAEVRRTHYPAVLAPKNNSSGGVISDTQGVRRCTYPNAEQRTNPAGYAQGVELLGGNDSGATHLWWDQKPF